MKFLRISSLAAATFALVVSGCAGAPSAQVTTGGTAPSAAAPATIEYWSWAGAPNQEVVAQLTAAFEAANPAIKVHYTEIPRDDYKAKAASALAAGEKIDVLSVQPGSWAAEVEDFLSPVSEWPNADALSQDFTVTTLDQTKRLFTDGQLLAVPLYSTGSAIGVYNADILKKVGVEPPRTVAEFKALSDALKAKDPKVLSAVMPADAWFQDEAALTVIGQSDADFFNNVRYNRGAWNTPSYVAGLDAYKKLYTDGVLPKATLDMDYATAMNAFDTGKAAVVFNGSWETGRILKGNYGIIPFPAQSADQASLRAFLDVTLGVPAKSENKAAAAAFIEYMAAGKGIDFWATQLIGIPAANGYQLPEGTLTTELQKKSYAELVQLINNPHSDRNNLGAFSDFVGANVLQVVNGNMSSTDAATSGQAKFEKGNF